MHRLLLILAILSSAQATYAGPFRGARIGEPCADFTQHEKSLNSTKIELSKPGWIVFLGADAGYSARILYVCKSGLLQRQWIVVAVPNRDDAMNLFDATKREMVHLLGKPRLDMTSLTADQIAELKKDGLYNPNYLMDAGWIRGHTHFGVSAREQLGHWLVTLSQGPGPRIVVIDSNKAFETDAPRRRAAQR